MPSAHFSTSSFQRLPTRKTTSTNGDLALAKSSSIAIENGAMELHGIRVDSYNLEIRKGDNWIGDQASRTAFWGL